MYQLHYGGSQSGKTTNICRWLLWQCYQYRGVNGEGIRIAIIRDTLASVTKSIFNDTFPTLFRMEGWERVKNIDKYKFHEKAFMTNTTEHVIKFSSGAEIHFFGLDNKEKADRILGNRFAHLYYNEGSLIDFYNYDLTKSRNSQKCVHVIDGSVLKNKILIDCNPPSRAHWLYTTFFEGMTYGDRHKTPLRGYPDRYGVIQMNPKDNIENLAVEYVESLESMAGKQRERFLLGEFQDTSEFALWQQDTIDATRVAPNMLPDMERVIIGVDPSVTSSETSDQTGIIVMGCATIDGLKHYYVLHDGSMHGLPAEWADRVLYLYRRWKADAVVAEINNGGQTIVDTIRHASLSRGLEPPHIYTVHSKRGKYLRAEPLSLVYNEKRVHHVFVFDELEKQMTSFTGLTKDDSPNNLDALVFAWYGTEHTGDFSTLNYTLKG